MFDANAVTTRRFISFIECTITGKWDSLYVYVTIAQSSNSTAFPVYRALQDGIIDVTLSDGTRKRLKFKPNGLVHIEQSIITFRKEDVDTEEPIGI